MSKATIIAEVAKIAGQPKNTTTAVVEALIAYVTSELKGRKEVRLAGLGTFKTTARAARTGVNPRTHAKMTIPATTVPSFKFSKTVKDAVSGK
ncbi:HU family DNA-binding protein [Treponema sp. R6D11]